MVHDRADREVPYAEGAQWSRQLARAQLLTTEHLGHNRILAAPEVTASITRFALAEPAVHSAAVYVPEAAEPRERGELILDPLVGAL